MVNLSPMSGISEGFGLEGTYKGHAPYGFAPVTDPDICSLSAQLPWGVRFLQIPASYSARFSSFTARSYLCDTAKTSPNPLEPQGSHLTVIAFA